MRPPPYPSILLCVALLVSPLPAQQPTATIEGMVTDPSGAVVPGAHITILGKASDFSLRLATTGGGAYHASGLHPGLYEVRVESPGFKDAMLAVKTEVGRVTRADLRLQVSAATEAITIRADQIRVNTAQSSLQGVVSGTQIHDLPLNGRNFLELGQLEPGAQVNDGSTVVV
ncbi:MAG TPA: carboxypeptidase-like regulatory domain-containing protein, partial [Terriglobales bacterium]|nr:carboxypeptidase-like regulatory domain-containing protein [Terriglobales bacterium]